MPFEQVLHLSEKLDLPLDPYPVGDLVSKLSNYGPENIIHKDKIKYDKNKNLKLSNFFINKKEESKENQKMSEGIEKKDDEKIKLEKSSELNEINNLDNNQCIILNKDKVLKSEKISTFTKEESNLDSEKNTEEILDFENFKYSQDEDVLYSPEISDGKLSRKEKSNESKENVNKSVLLEKSENINEIDSNIKEISNSDDNENNSQKDKIHEIKSSKAKQLNSKTPQKENTENKPARKRKSDASPDSVLSKKHNKLKKASLGINKNLLDNFLNLKKHNPDNKESKEEKNSKI
jgi:hypothetical protein